MLSQSNRIIVWVASLVIKQASIANAPYSIYFSPNVHQIVISNSLPTISNTKGYTITLNGGITGNCIPKIRLLASPSADLANLRIGLSLGDKVVVSGLAITGFADFGIEMLGSNNQLLSSFVGISPDGTVSPNGVILAGDLPNRPKGGVHIIGSNNSLGLVDTNNSANVISGNKGIGILVESGSIGNHGYYNLIGRLPDLFQSVIHPNTRGAIAVKPGGQLIAGLGNRIQS